MGSLSLPASGTIYVDTAPIIYTVERHPDYESLLLPLWAEADARSLTVVTSELTLLETLVKPLRDNNQPLVDAYEKLLGATSISKRPISANILRAAARIRATTKPNGESKLSIVEFIGSLPAGRGFHTSAEADGFLRQERESWDR